MCSVNVDSYKKFVIIVEVYCIYVFGVEFLYDR